MATYQILAVAFLLFILFLVLKPAIDYFRDPLNLRKYPTPSLLASITPLWLVRATWSQKRSRLLHNEFSRLGDVVRVSPNHIIFNKPAAIKDIYGVLATSRGILKDEFYDRVAGDAHDLVQLRDRAEHSGRRKAIANAFAAKTVVNMESIIKRTAVQLFDNIDRHIEEQPSGSPTPLNLRYWLNLFTLDVIGDTGFGLPMGFLEQLSDSADAESHDGNHYRVAETINTLHTGVRYSLTMGNITSVPILRTLKFIIARTPLAKYLGKTSGDDFENICIAKLRNRIETGAVDRASGDFMDFILNDKARSNGSEDEFGTKSFTDNQFQSLVADSVMMMNAGSDTTAAALTSTIWFLLQKPDSLQRLREELAPVYEKCPRDGSIESSIFDYDTVKDLPYLRACIDESLRLRPPIAYQLPRLVSRPTNIAGHDVLAGTVVAVAPFSIHRHPSLYKEPDDYRPERWVDPDEDFPNQREDLKRFNIVFSQGSRASIGRHLAIVELQILISSIFMRYDLGLTEESAKELKVFERFNSNPGPLPVTIQKRE